MKEAEINFISVDSDGLYFKVFPWYDFTINSIGKEENGYSNGDHDLWFWVTHLRIKQWWNNDLEKKLIEVVEKNIHLWKAGKKDT